MFRRFLLWFAVVSGCATSAFSANPNSILTPAERKVMGSADLVELVSASLWPAEDVLRAALRKATVGYAAKSYQCQQVSQVVIGDVRYGLLDAATERLLDRGVIKSVWHFFGSANFCGKKKMHKYALLQKRNGEYDAFILIPGTSYAWASLLRDVTRAVNGAVFFESVKKNPDCAKNEPLRFTNSQVVKDKKVGPQVFGIRYEGQWREKWTIERCGLEIFVLINFKADGQGGAYFGVPGKKVKSRKIKAG
jgi:hypothetical protein